MLLKSTKTATFAALITLLLAFGLRAFLLDGQSLWYDEGNSARMAERSVRLIIEGAAGDIHPPLYYLLLKFWRVAAGESEYALRFMSVYASTLTCALVCAICRSQFRAAIAPIALLLIAVNPASIYYAHEVRMYALLALWATASSFALVRLMQKPSNFTGSALALACFTACGLYTQYAYPFAMLAQGLWLVPRTVFTRKTGNFGLVALAYAAALALFLPWLPIAWRQITTWPTAIANDSSGLGGLENFVVWLLVWKLPFNEGGLLIGQGLQPLQDLLFYTIAVLLMTGVASVFALSHLFVGRKRAITWMMLLWLAVPVASMIWMTHLQSETYLKVLLVCVPPAALLAAQSIDTMARRMSHMRKASLFLCALCVAASIPPLRDLYFYRGYARDDYRGIARMIQAQWQSDDAVLFLAPNQWEVYTYYQRDDTRLFPLPYRPNTPEDADAAVAKSIAGARRVFVLFYSEQNADPNGWLRDAMARQLIPAYSDWHGNIRLAVYAPKSVPLGSGQTRFDPPRKMGRELELFGAQGYAETVRAGEVWRGQLLLKQLIPTRQNLKIFVHVGQPDAPPLAQFDGPLVLLAPASPLDVAVWLPPDFPLGSYGVYAGVYDEVTRERLIITDPSSADHRVRIAAINVTR